MTEHEIDRTYSFTKANAVPTGIDARVSALRFGVAWETSGQGKKGWLGKRAKKKGVDLDLVVIASQGPDAKRLCWFDHLRPFNSDALVHRGDNLTGRGDGDDEIVTVLLSKLPAVIDRLTVLAVAYKPGVTFDMVSGVTLSVYDEGQPSAPPLVQYFPTLGESGKNAVVMAQVTNSEQGWETVEINDMVEIPTLGQQGNDMPQFVRLSRRYHREAA